GASATIDFTTSGPAAGAWARAVVRGFTVQGLVAPVDLSLGPARAMPLGGFVVPGPEAHFAWKATAPGSITIGYTPDAEIEVLPEARLSEINLPCDAVSLELSRFDAHTAAPRGPKERDAFFSADRTVPIARTPDGPPVAKIHVGENGALVTVI